MCDGDGKAGMNRLDMWLRNTLWGELSPSLTHLIWAITRASHEIVPCSLEPWTTLLSIPRAHWNCPAKAVQRLTSIPGIWFFWTMFDVWFSFGFTIWERLIFVSISFVIYLTNVENFHLFLFGFGTEVGEAKRGTERPHSYHGKIYPELSLPSLLI